MKRRVFGELELAILEIIRKKGKASVKEVHHLLGEMDKYTTVMTVMTRLVQKGELTRKKVGAHYEYWQDVTKISQSFNLLNRLKEKIFSGKSFAMISYLIDSGEDISDEELTKMENLIQEAKKAKGKQ